MSLYSNQDIITVICKIIDDQNKFPVRRAPYREFPFYRFSACMFQFLQRDP